MLTSKDTERGSFEVRHGGVTNLSARLLYLKFQIKRTPSELKDFFLSSEAAAYPESPYSGKDIKASVSHMEQAKS